MSKGFGAMVELMREDLMLGIKIACTDQAVEKPLEAMR